MYLISLNITDQYISHSATLIKNYDQEKTGKRYRLPSEAEWEYACHAGTTDAFHFGETITPTLANYRNYGKGFKDIYEAVSKGFLEQIAADVGSFPSNAFGLYDSMETLMNGVPLTGMRIIKVRRPTVVHG